MPHPADHDLGSAGSTGVQTADPFPRQEALEDPGPGRKTGRPRSLGSVSTRYLAPVSAERKEVQGRVNPAPCSTTRSAGLSSSARKAVAPS